MNHSILQPQVLGLLYANFPFVIIYIELAVLYSHT